MAQKRMIDKKISISEQVANLPIEAQLIFTWSIPHADDLGLLPRSTRTLRAMLVPLWDVSVESFGNHLETIIKAGLWQSYEHKDGSLYYRIVKFFRHQTFKKDRSPQTLLPDVRTWAEVETLGFHLDSIGNQSEDNGNPREEKGSKGKGSKESRSPAEGFEEFWSAYPKKASKKKASEAWDKLNPDSELRRTIGKALEAHKRSDQWTKNQGQYIPHPTTWLNQERWNDELEAAKPPKNDKYDGIKSTRV